MSVYSKLKAIWKRLGIKGQVKNYSNEDVKRNTNRKIISYYVSGRGWLDFEETLKLVCYHQIDNARPVFPKKGNPYIRSKRDKFILNNFSKRKKL